LKDVPSVTNAVEHLQELALRMTSDEFGFSEEDVCNIDLVVEAIKELEVECAKLHDKLETETIHASILRHKLIIFPDEIKTEIQGAIQAARQSNADESNRLQTNLTEINENITALEEKHTHLELENAQLHPERDQVRQQHEEIIAKLNQRMAEKASKQIVLNETRDKLRETNQRILDLEEGIVQLKEDLIQERADARMEKKRLKKAVYDTTMKTREQKETNISKKKELDGLHESVMDSEGKLENIRKCIRRFETSRSRLEGQERALSAQLSKELKQNDDLRLKGSELQDKIIEQEEQWEAKKSEMEASIAKLKEDIETESKRNNKLEVDKMDIEAELAECVRERRADEERVKEQNEALQKCKQELAWKAEDVARIRSDNTDMEARIAELDETHEAIVATLQRQIEEYREQLSKERKERLELQEERDDVQKDIDDFKIQTTKYIHETNRKITEGKEEHDKLTQEGSTLQKTLRDDEDKVQMLKTELGNRQASFQDKKEKKLNDLQKMKDEIVSMEKELREKQEEIVNRKPGFEEFEKHFEEKSAEYDAAKKELVALKNKKLSLDDSVKRSVKELDKMKKPKMQLEGDLKKRRADNLSCLQSTAEGTRAIEREIYAVGCKLRTAIEENDRFNQSNTELQQSINDMEEKRKRADENMVKLNGELQKLKDILSGEWLEDNKLEQTYAERDQELVDELSKLLNKAGRREGVIESITSRLQSELAILSEFLDNVAKRRPKTGARHPRSAKSQGMLSDNTAAIDTVTRANLAMDVSSSSKVPPISLSPTKSVTKGSTGFITPHPPDTARSKKRGKQKNK